MDIANLQAFVAVAEQGSFSQAADHLHLTQPAISKRIALLEAELAVGLFDRLGRRVLLTEAGRALLPRARGILQELEDSRRLLHNLSGQVAGQLTVATSHHIGLHRLPPVLRRFVADYPGVQLDMRFTDSELGCEAVLRGEAELAIVTLPTVARPPLREQLIWEDPLVAVAGRDHPLSEAGPVEAKALATHPAILPGNITFTRQIVDDYFASHGLQPRIAFATNYLETIKMMVTVGLGWSILPRTMVDEGLVMLEIGLCLNRRLGVVVHSGHTLSNAARAMMELLNGVAEPGQTERKPL